MALVHGVVEGSYRTTAGWLNRIRHQKAATRVRTLQEVAEAEGAKVAACLEAAAEATLLEAGFSAEGVPLEPVPGLPRVGPKLDARKVATVVAGLEIDQTQRQQATNNTVPYEDPRQAVYLSIDDVWVHHQKDHRSLEPPEGVKAAQEASFVHTTVAHVATSAGSHVLSGASAPSVLRLVTAFLIANALVRRPLVVFVDGQRTLHAAIQKAFAWMGAMRIILDWYHLEKKCGVQLSLAMKGKAARTEALAKVSHLLWYGLIDEAIRALRGLPSQKVKNEEAIEALVTYLERTRAIVPCYAARKRLGLRNSSNVGEKHNDLIVSGRQKRKGMSWSQPGSHALAAITTLVRNGQHEQWFTAGEVDLRMAA